MVTSNNNIYITYSGIHNSNIEVLTLKKEI